MSKLLAIVKREYVQRVRSKMFVVVTLLGPVLLAGFSVVPALIFSIKAGGATRIAVLDQSGKMSDRVREALLREGEEEDTSSPENADAGNNNRRADQMRQAGPVTGGSFEIRSVSLAGRQVEDVRRELNEQVRKDQLDGYIIIPNDVLTGGKAQYYSRNVGDVITREQIKDRLSRVAREQRMADEHISANTLHRIDMPVGMEAFPVGEKEVNNERPDSGGSFYLIFAIGFVLYITLLMYGQVILAAVVEEKETRIAELLFSSVRAFPLMMGKLIGVSLVALTQYAIWGLAFAAFASYGLAMLMGGGMNASLPPIAPSVVLYFFLFFLLGYFIYATIYALIGSMVTTTQEGGQLALPVIFLLVVGFYLAFPVMRSPNSSFAFWASMFPFFSPITMPVRIVSQTPPFWQIGLSLLIGFATVLLLIWLAARIYRIGMLMYGKRASIPEVIRWVRQA